MVLVQSRLAPDRVESDTGHTFDFQASQHRGTEESTLHREISGS